MIRHFTRTLLLATVSAATERVAICALARDEGNFLAEWLDFYAYQQITRAYLYVDDATADDTWTVLQPHIDRGYVVAKRWPPKPNSTLAREIRDKGWDNAYEPLNRTRHFATCGHAHTTLARPSHCAGHLVASSHCVGRARAAGFAWIGLIDPDEFWFSPRFGTLPALLDDYHARGVVGLGQNAFIYGTGGVSGACASLGPITTTHLLRGNASGCLTCIREMWSKFPWVRLDKVIVTHVRVHTHQSRACVESTSELRRVGRGARRVDGVGRPKFDFHTDLRDSIATTTKTTVARAASIP